MTDMTLHPKVRVGFQNRNKTITGKLAYVTFINKKGKPTSAISFENWHTHDIPVVELDNVPSNTFFFSKGHTRQTWGHFGVQRDLIRVYDTRIEGDFEISVNNLEHILQYADIKSGHIDYPLIYVADHRGKVYLIVENSPEHMELIEKNQYTSGKVYKRDLIVGATYITKKGIMQVYLGDWPVHEWETFAEEVDNHKSWYTKVVKSQHRRTLNKKKKITWSNTEKSEAFGKYYAQIEPVSKISSVVDEKTHPQFHEMFEERMQNDKLWPAAGWAVYPAKEWDDPTLYEEGDDHLRRVKVQQLVEQDDEEIVIWEYALSKQGMRSYLGNGEYTDRGAYGYGHHNQYTEVIEYSFRMVDGEAQYTRTLLGDKRVENILRHKPKLVKVVLQVERDNGQIIDTEYW